MIATKLFTALCAYFLLAHHLPVLGDLMIHIGLSALAIDLVIGLYRRLK
jgi:hypothetical protein